MVDEKIDFKKIANFIFENKDKYTDVSDKDKEVGFFMINRKFAMLYPERADFLNKKEGDRASALDVWFKLFENKHALPKWFMYNTGAATKKKYKKLSKGDADLFLKNNRDINPRDLEFLSEFFATELTKEIKFLKRFENK